MANREIVNFIVDESGSMDVCRSQVISGFNEFVGDLKRRKDVEILLSLTKFSYRATVVYAAKRVQNVPDLDITNYEPAGGTALLDAVGLTVREVERKTAEETDKPTILCVIMTDGAENASREFKTDQIREMIKAKEAEGNWTFVYLGADQDAWAASASLGIAPGNTSDYKRHETNTVMAGLGTFAQKLSHSGEQQTRSFFGKGTPPKP